MSINFILVREACVSTEMRQWVGADLQTALLSLSHGHKKKKHSRVIAILT